jgi:hypothetical protein
MLQERATKISVVFNVLFLAISIFLIALNLRLQKEIDSIPVDSLGARIQYGLPCIYNNPSITLSDGEGSAYACDSSGKLIIAN